MNALMNVTKNGNHNETGLTPRGWTSLIDDLFNTSPFPSAFNSHLNTGVSVPKVNIRENKDEYFVDMAVPGMKKEDFNIDLDNEVLTVSAEQKVENENAEDNFTRKEFAYSSFKRTFTLPDSIDDSKINAKYTDGILSITLPKREEAKEKPVRTIIVS